MKKIHSFSPLPEASDGSSSLEMSTSKSVPGRFRASSFALLCVDVFAIVAAWLCVVPFVGWLWTSSVLWVLASFVLSQILFGTFFSLYRSRYIIGSERELRNQGFTAIAVFAVAIIVGPLLSPAQEMSWALLALLLAQAMMVFARHFFSLVRRIGRRPMRGEPVVVVGAGELSASLISQMFSDPQESYRPVAIIDDDPAKANLELCGVRVRGRIRSVAEVVATTGASGVIVGISAAPASVFATLLERLDPDVTWVRAVPSPIDMLASDIGLADIRNMDVSDLIGRPAAVSESEEIADLVHNQVVLVTGAGGSIGSELCRSIARHKPRDLIMLDRDESELHSLCLSMDGRALMDSPNLVLADIRDAVALDRAFAYYRPDIVVHAAALKHLPMLERYPAEGWKTNVHGTLNVLRAAEKYDVGRVVNISTDKAANPSSELGRSKFVAERLTSFFAISTGRPYTSVRFGNVLGSRGSVLISFADQIRRGGPITVTDPEVTRFFMTIPEACLLVLRAAAEGAPGRTLVLDMGEPVRIVDLARRVMALSGRSCPIVYTGLREGEKLHEELFSPNELDRALSTDIAWSVDISPLDPSEIPTPNAELVDIKRGYSYFVEGAYNCKGVQDSGTTCEPLKELSDIGGPKR